MYQYKGLEDTIVAISTPTGHGGIGIVRLSGQDALKIADQMFKARSGKPVSGIPHASVRYGWIIRKQPATSSQQLDDEIIDEVLLSVMRGPKSYTCEDVVEISCHGGFAALRSILELAVEKGARLAEPGEFTKRAFLNGRIDLTQAEAVLDIIHSKTDSFLKVSTNQLKGELSTELETIRQELMSIYVELEALVNFPEDEIDSQGREKIAVDIDRSKEKLNQLLSTSDQGRILRDGIKIVLCGKPNVGKSSLLNALLRQPRAIVSDIAGTTRDVIEESAQIKGVPIQLVDTAGILEPRDLIEEEAIKRSHLSIASADLVLLLFDVSQVLVKEDLDLMSRLKNENVLVVLNKVDLDEKIDRTKILENLSDKKIIEISALQKSGVEELQNQIIESVIHSSAIDPGGIMISNMRHIEALKKGRDLLDHAQGNIRQNLSLEFVSEDIKQTVNCLDNVTGRNIDSDLLETIFSQFCIGK